MNEDCSEFTDKIDTICKTMGNKRNPSLKLFMSFDLINSTSFKHSHKAKESFSEVWYDFFKNFYNQMPLYVQRSYEALKPRNKDVFTEKSGFTLPYLWKNLGDEVIYVADIAKIEHVIYHIMAMKTTISDHNESENIELLIQGTSWLAGFPVTNSVIFDETDRHTIETSQSEILKNKHVDFIGPTIDLGFRISKFATKTKLVLSASLAYNILTTLENERSCVKHKKDFKFYFDGQCPTKGINNGEYPVVWIDTDSPLDDEDKLLKIKYNECDNGILLKYLQSYLKKSSNKIIFPFVYEEAKEMFIKKTISDNIKNSLHNFCIIYIQKIEKIYSNKGANYNKSSSSPDDNSSSNMDKLNILKEDITNKKTFK